MALDFLNNLFGKGKKDDLLDEKLFEEERFDVRDIIAPPYIGVMQDYIKLGERFAKSFFVFSYPRYLNTGWFSPVIDLNTPMDISFFIHPVNSALILKKLRKKLTEVSSEILEREEKGLVRDPTLETAYKDIENLRDNLMTAQEKMFRFGLYITVYENSEKELKDTELTLRSIFESRLIYIKPALFRQKEGFISCNPYGLDLIQVHTPMDTAPLSTSFPFISFDLSSNEGILYGINRHNNSLVLFDRFSLENANLVCFAKSGSGKSILGSEPVLTKNNGKIELKKIGSLIENLIKKHGAERIDDELEGVINPELEVYSFDKNLKGSWSKVTVAARKTATDVFYKFKTKSGREITTTGDHNMLILKEGKVIAAKSSEIKEGEYIPLPRSVSPTDTPITHINLLGLLKNARNIYVSGAENLIKENYPAFKNETISKKFDRYLYKYRDGRIVPIQYFWKILRFLKINEGTLDLEKFKIVSKNGAKKYSLSANFPITNGFLKVVGFITAEGTIRDEVIIISNDDKEVISDIDKALKEIKIPFFHSDRAIIIAARVFVEIIKALGGKNKSGGKKVIPLIFNLNKEKIARYLSSYFEGDGGIDGPTVTATSKSKRLISEISYLLFYFGVIARVSKTKKQPANSNWKFKKVYYRLTISGQENLRKFAEQINFISVTKQQKLLGIIKKDGNTNVDIIPEIKNYFEEIFALFGCQLYGIQDISAIKRGIYNPSPENLSKIIKKIEERIASFKESAPTFKILNELPQLAHIISSGRNNKKINKALWRELGNNWQTMRSGKIIPGSKNVFKAAKEVNGNDFSLISIKEKIHSGFLEMNLPLRHYNPSLATALVERRESDTAYPMIEKSARFVWENYQDILENKIPRVEQLLNQLKILANSDLFWDPIVEIKKIKNRKEKYVYDLTVDNEVFLAGTAGMFVHNSFAIKLEILRYLMQGIDVLVLDPENEYEALADAVGGSFLKISLTSPHHLNPFDLPLPGPDENPDDILRSNIINLVGLLRIMLGGLSPEEDSILDEALTETYAVRDITAKSDPKTWQNNIPLMSDFQEVLESMAGTESLVKRIKKYTKGTFSDFFNQQTNISIDKNLVVFGIRDMEESLRPIALYIIMRYVWNIVRTKLKKRLLVIDEAWWLMQSDDGASFLFGMAKRGRKYWLGLTTITQNVSDFMGSDYGRAIITNSSLQLLMKQSTGDIDLVEKTFNLTEQEKYILLEAAVGEGLFFAGRKHVAISVVASQKESEIITTDPSEVLKMREEKRKLAENS